MIAPLEYLFMLTHAATHVVLAGILIWLDGELRGRRSYWVVLAFAIGVLLSTVITAGQIFQQSPKLDILHWSVIWTYVVAACIALTTLGLHLFHWLSWRSSIEQLRAKRGRFAFSGATSPQELDRQVTARTKQLVEENTRLVEGEAYYRRLYRSTPIMMHSLNENGEISEVSDHWLLVMGYTAEEVIGVKPEAFRDPDGLTLPQSILPDWRDDETSKEMQHHCYCTKSGELIEVEETSVPDLDVLTGISSHCVLIDVTERNEAINSLRAKSLSLERANNSLRQFAYIASHDLQEPLRKIASFTDFLRLSLESGEEDEVKYAMEVLSSAAVRARALVTDLLTYSRISNQDIEKEKIDLAALINHVLDEVVDSIDEAGGQVRCGISPVLISADRAQVRSLLINLLTNAVKYRSPDRSLDIHISGLKIDDGYELTISDNGIGFDPKYAKTIFEPFRRLHSDQVIKGTGIGLAICSSVADRHGWSISAEPILGKGTRFIVTMPAASVSVSNMSD